MLPTSLHKVFDVGVIKEGWKSLLELIRLYLSKREFNHLDLSKIRGIVYYSGEKLLINECEPQLKSLDDVPIIDYNLINPKYFLKKPIIETYSYGVQIAILTSIGCPYNCRFCSSRAFWKTVRYYPINHVVEEIKTLVNDFHVTHIDFIDDLFFINKNRMREIYEALKKEGLIGRFTIGCQGRVDLLDEEVCKLLKKMNCKIIEFGFESGSNKVLKYLKRGNTTVEDNKKAILLCKKFGFIVYGNVILGSPIESLKDINDTKDFIKFAKKAGTDRIYASILVPYPGTEMWELAKKRGTVDDYDMNWDRLSFYEKDRPHLLNKSINLEVFQKKYKEIKKITNTFTYKVLIKTFLNNPKGFILNFLENHEYYLKRFNFTFRKEY